MEWKREKQKKKRRNKLNEILQHKRIAQNPFDAPLEIHVAVMGESSAKFTFYCLLFILDRSISLSFQFALFSNWFLCSFQTFVHFAVN